MASSKRFCEEALPQTARHTPPVVHQRFLSTALWRRTGIGVSSQRDAKALFIGSLRTRFGAQKSVIEQVRLTAKTLTPEMAEQIEKLLLTQDRKSVQLLQDKTLNFSSVVTNENIASVPQMMKDGLTEEIEAQSPEAEVRSVKAFAKKREISIAQQSVEAAEAERLPVQMACEAGNAEICNP
ncbi:MAG: hypothetical protein R3C58_03645 [Parvularculaceae bacterium]